MEDWTLKQVQGEVRGFKWRVRRSGFASRVATTHPRLMRRLLAPLILSLASCASASGAPAGGPAPVKVIPGYFGEARAPDGNTIVFEGKDGLVVVDTGRHLDHQEKILAYAIERGKPIVAIVNTHWHLDH